MESNADDCGLPTNPNVDGKKLINVRSPADFAYGIDNNAFYGTMNSCKPPHLLL